MTAKHSSARRRSRRSVEEIRSPSIAPGQGGFYDHPDWYDIVHAEGTAEDTRGLLRILETHCTREIQRLLEPACGSGRYLRALALKNKQVLGYDLNPRMVEYAAGRLRRFGEYAKVVLGDMTTFIKPGWADAAFNLINSFRLLLDEQMALDHLHCIEQSLAPGGVYILGVDLTDPAGPEVLEDTWTGVRGQCKVKHLMVSVPQPGTDRRERIVNHITVRTPSRTTHLQSTFDLQTYDPGQWLALIDRSGFAIRAVFDFSWERTEFSPDTRDGHFVLARKRDL